MHAGAALVVDRVCYRVRERDIRCELGGPAVAVGGETRRDGGDPVREVGTGEGLEGCGCHGEGGEDVGCAVGAEARGGGGKFDHAACPVEAGRV